MQQYDAPLPPGERRTLATNAPAVATVSNYGTFNIPSTRFLPDQSLILGICRAMSPIGIRAKSWANVPLN